MVDDIGGSCSYCSKYFHDIQQHLERKASCQLEHRAKLQEQLGAERKRSRSPDTIAESTIPSTITTTQAVLENLNDTSVLVQGIARRRTTNQNSTTINQDRTNPDDAMLSPLPRKSSRSRKKPQKELPDHNDASKKKRAVSINNQLPSQNLFAASAKYKPRNSTNSFTDNRNWVPVAHVDDPMDPHKESQEPSFHTESQSTQPPHPPGHNQASDNSSFTDQNKSANTEDPIFLGFPDHEDSCTSSREEIIEDTTMDIADLFPPPDPDIEFLVDKRGRRFPVGTTFPSSLEESLKKMPNLSPQDEALLNLYTILAEVGCPHKIFDQVVELVESSTSTGVWKKGVKLDRRNTFVTSIRKQYPSPSPEKVEVQLEPAYTDGNGILTYPTAFVYRFPFQPLIVDQLTDPEFYANLDNLAVNKEDPFSKYIPTSPADPEVHAGRWYQETWDLVVRRNGEDLPITIILFIDKAGARNDAQQRYGVEPVIACLTIKRYAHRNSSKHWFCLGYMPDLEQSSAALKKVYGSRNDGFGYTSRNYHKCMEVLLESLVDAMENPFCAFVQLGNQTRVCRIHIRVALIMGDGKSHDMLGGRLKTLNKGTKRMSPCCDCCFADAADPWYRCKYVRSDDIDTLNKTIEDSSKSPRYKEQAKIILRKYATYQHRSAFQRILFGANLLGLLGALANDFMHMFELGVLGYKLVCFVGTMTNSVQLNVDIFQEYLFKHHRSTDKKNQHRTNFTRGSTRLTLLRAHEWPGVALGYLIMLLTDRGRAICKSCFLEKESDVQGTIPVDHSPNEPYFNRDSFFPMQVHPTNDVELDKATKSNTDGDHPEEEAEEEDDNPDNDGAEPGADPRVNPEDPGAKKHPKKKRKKANKKAKPLNCTIDQFIDLLEEALLMHAWYKYATANWGNQESLQVISKKLREFMAKVVHHMPRDEGNGWHLQKFHGLLHLVKDLDLFRHERNFDASAGEAMLRFFVKFIGATCQMRSQEVYIGQMSERLSEAMSFRKAMIVKESAMIRLDNQVPSIPIQSTSDNMGKPMYVMFSPYDRNEKCRWMGSKPTDVHPLIINWFQDNWDFLVGEDEDNSIRYIQCWTEFVNNGTRYKCHPNYQSDGAFYDYANVTFQFNNSNIEEDFPAKLLCFFKHPVTKEILVLSNMCGQLTGTNQERRDKRQTMRLCQQRELESTVHMRATQTRAAVRIPKLVASVAAVCLRRLLDVREETPGLEESFTGGREKVWVVKDRKTSWPQLFLPSSHLAGIEDQIPRPDNTYT